MKKDSKAPKEKKDTQVLAFTSLCSVIMIFILVFSVFILSNTRKKSTEVTKYVVETEYVYITAETSVQTESETLEEDTIAAVESAFETLVAKEYMDKIGIFDLDGELLYSIDVYAKSLPEADRLLLKEGITITEKKQLYDILQDYSG